MQLNQSITMENLKTDRNPLALSCHPLGKLKFVSDVICATFSSTELSGFEDFNIEGMFAMSEIIGDAVEEIELLIKISNEQFNAMEQDLKELKASQVQDG